MKKRNSLVASGFLLILLAVFLSSFLLVFSIGFVNGGECSSGSTGTCIRCSKFNGNWATDTSTLEWVKAGTYTQGGETYTVTKSGYYNCDDYSQCSSKTRLCNYRECLTAADCGTGKTCENGVCKYVYYRDADGDGYGNPTNTITSTSSSPPQGYVANRTDGKFDCNDNNSSINPGVQEVCGNSIDDDCDGQVDESGCVSTFTINNIYWANLRNINQSISSADLNDRVLMVVNGSGLSGNINYSIYKQNDLISSFLQGAQTSTLAYSTWLANQSGTFYFKTKISTIENQSNNLTVSSSPNNTRPVAVIVSPANGLNVSVNTSIDFNHSSYDEDDLLKVEWDFGDGNRTTFENYSLALTPGLGNTRHTYTSPGVYTVKLIVTEMTRTQTSEATRTIYVFSQGINVFPVITKPEEGANYDNGVVPFNASQSYVINCTAGNCPSGQQCFSAGNLNCSYIHSPGRTTTNGYNLTLNWTIQNQQPVVGNWNSTNIAFYKFYSMSGTFTARLRLTFTQGSTTNTGEAGVSFKTQGGWACNATQTTAFWVRGSERIDATKNCSLYTSRFYPSCCPTGNAACENNICGGGEKKYCWEFNTSSSCNSASSTIASASVPDSSICGSQTSFVEDSMYCFNVPNCRCKWDSNSSKCLASVNYTKNCITEDGTLITLPIGECSWTTSIEGDCSKDDSIFVKSIASWTPPGNAPAWCTNGSNTYLCPATAKLSFISEISLIIAIILIVAVYLVIAKEK